MSTFSVTGIEHVDVMDSPHPTREKLDNLADVRFRRDARFPASRRNRTSARLSNFTRFGWVASKTPTFSMGPIQNACIAFWVQYIENVRRFGCIALKTHVLRFE